MGEEFRGTRGFHDVREYHREAARDAFDSRQGTAMSTLAAKTLAAGDELPCKPWRCPFGTENVSFRNSDLVKQTNYQGFVPSALQFAACERIRAFLGDLEGFETSNAIDLHWTPQLTSSDLNLSVITPILPPGTEVEIPDLSELQQFLTAELPPPTWSAEQCPKKLHSYPLQRAIRNTETLVASYSTFPDPIEPGKLFDSQALPSSFPSSDNWFLFPRNDFVLEPEETLSGLDELTPTKTQFPNKLDFLPLLPTRDESNTKAISRLAALIKTPAETFNGFEHEWESQPSRRDSWTLTSPVMKKPGPIETDIAFDWPSAARSEDFSKKCLEETCRVLEQAGGSIFPPASRVFKLDMEPISGSWPSSCHPTTDASFSLASEIFEDVRLRQEIPYRKHLADASSTLSECYNDGVDSWERLGHDILHNLPLMTNLARDAVHHLKHFSSTYYSPDPLSWSYSHLKPREDDSLASCLVPFEKRKGKLKRKLCIKELESVPALSKIDFGEEEMESFISLVTGPPPSKPRPTWKQVRDPVGISVPPKLESTQQIEKIAGSLLLRRSLVLLPGQNEFSSTAVLTHSLLSNDEKNQSVLWIGSCLDNVRNAYNFHLYVFDESAKLDFIGRRDLQAGITESRFVFHCFTGSIPAELRRRKFTCVICETTGQDNLPEELKEYQEEATTFVVLLRPATSPYLGNVLSLTASLDATVQCLNLSQALADRKCPPRIQVELHEPKIDQTLFDISQDTERLATIAFPSNSSPMGRRTGNPRNISLLRLEEAIERMSAVCRKNKSDVTTDPRIASLAGLHIIRSAVEHVLIDGFEVAKKHFEELPFSLSLCEDQLANCLAHMKNFCSDAAPTVFQSALQTNVDNLLSSDLRTLFVFPSSRSRDKALSMNSEARNITTSGSPSLVFCSSEDLEGHEWLLKGFDKLVDCSVDLHGALKGDARVLVQILLNAGRLSLKHLSVVSFDRQVLQVPFELDENWHDTTSSSVDSLFSSQNPTGGIQLILVENLVRPAL